MTEIDPTEVETGETMVVSDNDSRYDGTEGRVLMVFDHYISLSLNVKTHGHEIVKTFSLDQLKRA